MKFRIHAFESVRRTYEVNAESIEAAYAMLDDLIDSDTPVDSEATGEYSADALIDPILPNGEVDFDNARWFLTENGAAGGAGGATMNQESIIRNCMQGRGYNVLR